MWFNDDKDDVDDDNDVDDDKNVMKGRDASVSNGENIMMISAAVSELSHLVMFECEIIATNKPPTGNIWFRSLGRLCFLCI